MKNLLCRFLAVGFHDWMGILFFGLPSVNCGEGVLNGTIDFAIVRVPPCGVKLKAFLDEL